MTINIEDEFDTSSWRGEVTPLRIAQMRRLVDRVHSDYLSEMAADRKADPHKSFVVSYRINFICTRGFDRHESYWREFYRQTNPRNACHHRLPEDA
jgi:hypothetical protein